MTTLSKDSFINFRSTVAYFTGALKGIIVLVEDIPEFTECICDQDHFKKDDLKSLQETLNRFHRAFYY